MIDYSKIDSRWFALSEYLDSIYYLSETAWEKLFNKTYLPCDTIMTPLSFFRAVEVCPLNAYFYFGFYTSDPSQYFIFKIDESGFSVIASEKSFKKLIIKFLKENMSSFKFQYINKKNERIDLKV